MLDDEAVGAGPARYSKLNVAGVFPISNVRVSPALVPTGDGPHAPVGTGGGPCCAEKVSALLIQGRPSGISGLPSPSGDAHPATNHL